MKLEHAIEPILRVQEKLEPIQINGCVQVSLMFMLRPEGFYIPEDFVNLSQKMLKAACDVIDQHNREQDPPLEVTPL